MAHCTNCQSTLSCGCQQRIASDGKQVCANCLAAYEKRIEINNANSKRP